MAGRVQAWMHEPPSVPGDPLHRRAPGGARGRSGCRRWGAQAAGRQVGFPRCRDPLARGVPGRPRGFLISQPGCGGSPSSRPRARAPAPARARPPGSLRVSHPLHPGPQLTATHWLQPAQLSDRICSAPPPPPPETLLPPRRPRASPSPPPGARPRSASPCAATRPGGPDAPSLSLRSGRSLRLIRERNRCARAFASESIRNSQVHPRGRARLCSGRCLRFHFGFQETASFT